MRRKYKIQNINKKLIAGVLTFALAAIPLTGCDAVSLDNISYKTNTNGEMSFTVSKEILNYCSFYRVYNNKINK